ncbi:hypothetical protein [Microcystis aeruginosa]|uniref:Uncharacterized protein n=1 Tax=Microcystis aeruginosa PCC 9701 TaxID=721123 RepID=I4IR99_MICAE|nr:hypothetical protein [Microcystis aeruginosa]CCI36823.1 hypothetical protein MICAK_2750002 [Microcystis aeruginosa PCC 9701]
MAIVELVRDIKREMLMERESRQLWLHDQGYFWIGSFSLVVIRKSYAKGGRMP